MAAKKHSGRKTTYTKEKGDEICSYVSIGLSYTDAIRLAGIPERTFYQWKKNGENNKTPYKEFLQELKKAEAAFKAVHTQRLQRAAEAGTWQASAWLLERKFPEEYGRSVHRVEQSGSLNVITASDVANIMRAIRRVLRQYPEAAQAVDRALSGMAEAEKGA